MQSDDFFKCPCQKCGGHIEFPSSGIGQTIACPHCGHKTKLFFAAGIAEAEATQLPRKKISPILLILIGVIALAAVTVIVLKKNSSERAETAIVTPPAGPISVSAPKPEVRAQIQTQDWNGLKSGEVTLDKSKGSRLIYATGSIRNESDHEKFGIQVQLDLFNDAGDKIGTASDYIQSIQPGKAWKFKALVTDSKATRAQVASVKEN